MGSTGAAVARRAPQGRLVEVEGSGGGVWGRPAGWVPPPASALPPPAPGPPPYGGVAPDAWAHHRGFPVVPVETVRRSNGTWLAVLGALCFLAGFVGPVMALAMVVWGFTAGTDASGEPKGPDGWGMAFAVYLGGAWLVVWWVIGLVCLLSFGIVQGAARRRERRSAQGPGW